MQQQWKMFSSLSPFLMFILAVKDPLQMCFQCEWWGTKSRVCPHSRSDSYILILTFTVFLSETPSDSVSLLSCSRNSDKKRTLALKDCNFERLNLTHLDSWCFISLLTCLLIQYKTDLKNFETILETYVNTKVPVYYIIRVSYFTFLIMFPIFLITSRISLK